MLRPVSFSVGSKTNSLQMLQNLEGDHLDTNNVDKWIEVKDVSKKKSREADSTGLQLVSYIS